MSCIILVDLRENNGSVLTITDDTEEGNIKIFDSLEEALACVKTQPLCQNFPYMVLDLDLDEVVYSG